MIAEMPDENSEPQFEESRFSKYLHAFSARIHRGSFFAMTLQCNLRVGISEYFGWYGEIISQRPWTAIIACLLLSVILTCAYFGIMKKELDSKELFTPNTAQSFKDEDYYEHYYGKPPSQTRLVITRNVDLENEMECDKRSILPNEELAKKHLLSLLSIFQQIQSISIEHEGRNYSLQDLCVKPLENGPCKVISVLDAWNYNQTSLSNDPDPIKTLHSPHADVFGLPSNFTYLLGGSKDKTKCGDRVEAIQSFIILNYEAENIDGAHYDPKVRKWNEALMKMLKVGWNENGQQSIIAYMNNLDAINHESERTLKKDQKLMWIAYFIVLVYCHIALFKNSWTQIKSHLAIVSCLSVVMAIYSSYGLAQIFGVKFNPVHRVLPFLLMGLGVDDTFVIMSAYHATDITSSVSERIKETSVRAGSAILVTSITDFVAFLSGVFTSLTALRDFSIYAALGILLDFLYQITFFLAFLVLEARRERRRFLEKEEQNLFSNGNSNHHDSIPGLKSFALQNGSHHEAEPIPEAENNDLTEALIVRSTFTESKIVGCGNYTPRASFTTILAGHWLPKLTLNPLGKRVVIFLEFILIGFAIYGCTQVKMDFRYEDWFVPKGSYLEKAARLERNYFTGNQLPFHAITKELKSGDHFNSQHQLSLFAEALRQDSHVAHNPPIRSWYEDFLAYTLTLPTPPKLINNEFVNRTEFMTVLHQFLQGPGKFYSNNIIFSESGEQIESTRVSGFTNDIKTGWYAVHTVDSLRHTATKAAPDLHPIVYSYGFLYYDGYRVIAWETTRNVMIAAAAVFLMSLVILANFSACFSVLCMVALTDVMLFGMMWYVDLTFNSVTCICMVLAVGIAVDYSVHIAHTFLVVPGSKQQRAEKSLSVIGGAVLNGAFTTLLAVIVLGFADHYIFRTFFKMFLGIVICGAWHGLIILPVMLSFVGPRPYISEASLNIV